MRTSPARLYGVCSRVQVGELLKAGDTDGRPALRRVARSNNEKVFPAVVSAMRTVLGDDEVRVSEHRRPADGGTD